MHLPTGTVTFLFTDIESSTKLWERYPEAMRDALARHDLLLHQAMARHGGYVFKTVGDAFCTAFPTALSALAAAIDAQQALHREPWGETGRLHVRMGLHTGEAQERDNDYFGQTLNRVARLLSVAYGDQILTSQATYELIRDHLPDPVTIRPLGLHRLKDLNRGENLYQVLHPDLPSEFPPLRSLDSIPNNLPIQLTTFIGREREITAIRQLLETHRLVTLLGTGGAGKTRLSLQVGADLLERFPDGVFFVELASVTDPGLVVQAVASVLGAREEPGRPLMQTLVEFLRARTVLLILDNCEHLVAACARLSQSLLQACAHLTILASSREVLNVPGEAFFRVPSLGLPDPKTVHPIESLCQYEAVRLFIDRATHIQGDFAVTNETAPALAEICYRLDGIPLAIELAAARVRSLSVPEINNRLDNCFRLLTGGSRTALPRQQTLRALVDWSYDLLTDTEKTLFRRLSVFRGGWTLEAAECVCAGEGIEDWETLDLLTSLSDKSLIVAAEQEGKTRYRLLETIRQYASDRLREGGENAPVEARHETYYQAFAEKTTARLLGAEQQASLSAMQQEHANLRSALDRMLERGASESLEMANALGLFWYLAGYLGEGREELEKALAVCPEEQPADLRADGFYQIGRLAVEQHDLGAARGFLETALTLFRQVGNQRGAANVLNSLGTVSVYQNDYSPARAYLEESLALQRELGYQPGIGAALANLGNLMQDLGEYERSLALYTESRAIYEAMGHQRGIATTLMNLGNTLFLLGDLPGARSAAEESLRIGQELDDEWYIAYSLCSLAAIARQELDLPSARTMAEGALDTVTRVGDLGQAATARSILGEVALLEGDLERADALLRESLRVQHQAGQQRETVVLLELFAALCLARWRSAGSETDARNAVLLLASAAAQRHRLGTPLPPVARPENDRQMSEIQSVLAPDIFAQLWEQGHGMTIEQAVVLALTREGQGGAES